MNIYLKTINSYVVFHRIIHHEFSASLVFDSLFLVYYLIFTITNQYHRLF